MRIDKLFKVLVVGGSVLTAGCGDGATPAAEHRAVTAEADVPDAASAQADAGATDAGATDVGAGAQDDASADAGVLAWLSWV